jgi:hypothetical protein
VLHLTSSLLALLERKCTRRRKETERVIKRKEVYIMRQRREMKHKEGKGTGKKKLRKIKE